MILPMGFLENMNFRSKWGLLLVLGFVSAIVIRILHLQNFTYDSFLDRDLYRALVTDELFWLYGSELSGGGRTPGGFQNIYLWALSQLTGSGIMGIHALSLLFSLLTCVYLSHLLSKKISPATGALYLLLSLCSYPSLEQSLVFWNPTLAAPFINLFYICLLLYLTSDTPSQDWALALVGGFSLGLAAQFHTSNNILLFVFILLALFFKPSKWSQTYSNILILTLGYAATLSPYLIYKIRNAGPDAATYVLNSESTVLILNWDYALHFLATFLHPLGLIIPSINEGMQWNYRDDLNDFGVWKFLFVAISLVPFILGAFGGARSLKSKSKSFNGKVLATLIFLVVTSHLLITLGQTSYELNVRRFLWLFPLILFFSSYGITHLNRPRLMFALLFTFITTQYFFYFQSLHKSRSPETYLYKMELIDYLKSEGRLQDQNISRKIALIAREDYNGIQGPFILKTQKTHDGSGLETLLWTTRKKLGTTPAHQGHELCVGTIRANSKELERLAGIDEVRSFISAVNPELAHKMDNLKFGKEGIYFTYEAPDENCYNYFTNYYYVTAQKRVRELKAQGTFSQGQLNSHDCKEYLFQEIIDELSYDIYLELCDRGSLRKNSLYMTTGAFMAWEDQPAFIAQNKVLETLIELRIGDKVLYSGRPLRAISNSPSKEGPFIFSLPGEIDLSQDFSVNLLLNNFERQTF